jgi:hypothetical protein
MLAPTDPPSQVAGEISTAPYTVSRLTAGATYF